MVLQFIQTLATLYLPTLNADIIDNGVVTGDTGYIMRVGGGMLAVTAAADRRSIVAVYFGARTAMAVGPRHPGRHLRPGAGASPPARSASSARPSLITRTTNDVQQVQMLVLLTFTLMVSAPIMCVGGVVLALRQDVPLSRSLLVIVPVLILLVGLIIVRMRPLFRTMQERIDRINRVMREQITGIRVIRAFVRDEHEQAPVRRSQRRADRRLAAGRQADGADVPDRAAGHEPVQCGRAVVRRAPDRLRRHADRRADRVPQLPDADPVARS